MLARVVSAGLLVAYSALLIKVMVFKDLPTIRIGQLMLNFGGTDAGHAPNFVPFATILPYLLGHKGLIIAGVNLIGNIVLLVPAGFLLLLVYRNITWKQSLVVAVASGLAIETLQTLLRVGIFDIDDVILNALGVMIGYWAAMLLSAWIRERKYVQVGIAALLSIAVALGALYVIYPHDQPVVHPGMRAGADLCGGTGGNGQIISLEDDHFTIVRREGGSQVVILAREATIETSAGPGSATDLKTGDRVTLVGGPNPDGSFTADTVVVCSMPNSETQSEQ